MNRQMGTIDDLIDELGKSTDKWSRSNMSELARLCYNAIITILELQDDVKLFKRMWYHAHSEAHDFKVENTKLRELARDTFGGYKGAVEMLPFSYSKNVAKMAVMDISDRMRELGMEVD